MKNSIVLIFILTSTLVFAQGSEDFEGSGEDLLPGWLTSNQSSPPPSPDPVNWGVTSSTDPFGAQEGVQFGVAIFASTGDSTTEDGILCNYLISPPGVAGDLTFWTRSQRSSSDGITVFPDRMHVRYSLTEEDEVMVGDCTNSFGDFTEELLVINPDLAGADWPVGYPVDEWTEFTVTIPAGTGRVAFIHYVTDAGTLGVNSNRISLDTVSWTETSATGEVPIFKNGFE
ncbi:MAG: choice-of-anchor J domain-containing protein [Proteobacteria bacterium]|nr:choice-of-anchor J domain-containing protein [Pseudomonadota bacterium]